MTLRIEVLDGGKVQGRIVNAGAVRRIRAGFGEIVSLDQPHSAGAVA
jgi:hypothetical protein